MRRRLIADPEVARLVDRYVERLHLPTDDLWVTDDRATFGQWLSRRIPAAYGGAYCHLAREDAHVVLINVPRIDLSQPRSLEIVVCEELVHMRDHLDGDRRRHAHHGHDRIAARVAALTGASLDEIRGCLIPVARREPRYTYRCPRCAWTIRRRVRGTWSCGRCSPTFRKDLVLQLVADAVAVATIRDPGE